MADSPQRLAQRLQSEFEKTRLFYTALTPEQWEQQVYTEGACWTVRQVLAHQASAETSFRLLIENILSGGPGSPEDFDLNAYNERYAGKLAGQPPFALLERFAESRRQIIDLVNTLSPADLQKKGRHPFLGVSPLEDIIKMIYRHNQIHQREIRKVLAPDSVGE